jgi:hypothetical protein
LKILAHHVIVQPASSAPSNLKSARGVLPHFSGDWRAVYGVDGNRWFYQHCRIVDHPHFNGDYASTCMGGVLSGIEILRLLSTVTPGYRIGDYAPGLSTYAPQTVVVFGALPLADGDGSLLWPGLTLPPLKRVVWTVSGVAAGDPSGNRVFRPMRTRLDSAVLHFRNFEASSNHDKIFARLGEVLDCLVSGSSTAITIVDLDTVGGLDDFEERQIHLVEQLKTRNGLTDLPIEFMTGKEYCTQYGEEQYRIETCEKLW